MSTFVEIIPTEHATKRTTALRIDDDLKLTIREEEAGKPVNHIRPNYSGLDEGDHLTSAQQNLGDRINFVNVTKLGDDARAVIGVEVYHAVNEAHTVPRAGLYWYRTSSIPSGTHYDPQEILQVAKGEVTENKSEANNANFAEQKPPKPTTQPFPSLIFNISTTETTTAFPAASPRPNPDTVSFTAQSLYTRLGTTNARRDYLKQKIRSIIEHPDFAIWMANADNDGTEEQRDQVGELYLLIARPQTFVIWLEMITNVISIDANLTGVNAERKFNLLNGDLSLNGREIFTKIQPVLGTSRIRGANSDRARWTFYRLGNVASSSPWAYTAPTASIWSGQTFTDIVLTGADLGTAWLSWLRS